MMKPFGAWFSQKTFMIARLWSACNNPDVHTVSTLNQENGGKGR